MYSSFTLNHRISFTQTATSMLSILTLVSIVVLVACAEHDGPLQLKLHLLETRSSAFDDDHPSTVHLRRRMPDVHHYNAGDLITAVVRLGTFIESVIPLSIRQVNICRGSFSDMRRDHQSHGDHDYTKLPVSCVFDHDFTGAVLWSNYASRTCLSGPCVKLEDQSKSSVNTVFNPLYANACPNHLAGCDGTSFLMSDVIAAAGAVSDAATEGYLLEILAQVPTGQSCNGQHQIRELLERQTQFYVHGVFGVGVHSSSTGGSTPSSSAPGISSSAQPLPSSAKLVSSSAETISSSASSISSSAQLISSSAPSVSSSTQPVSSSAPTISSSAQPVSSSAQPVSSSAESVSSSAPTISSSAQAVSSSAQPASSSAPSISSSADSAPSSTALSNPCDTCNGGCDINALCSAQPDNTPFCTCQPGYAGTGQICTPIAQGGLIGGGGSLPPGGGTLPGGGGGSNTCLTFGCSGGLSTCVTINATPICVCQPGYISATGVDCVDINECAACVCPVSQTCVNTVGSFTCSARTFSSSGVAVHSSTAAAGCAPPLVTCSGVCTDLTSSNTNCGACSRVCTGGKTCFSSICA